MNSHGERKLPVKTALLMNFLSETHNVTVSVPASISANIYLFDVYKEVDRVFEARGKSLKSLSRNFEIFVNALRGLDWSASPGQGRVEVSYSDGGEFSKLVRDLGLNESETTDLLSTVANGLGRAFATSGISSLIVKDLLENEGVIGNLTELPTPNFGGISNAIAACQGLYSDFALSESVEAVAAKITDMFKGDPIFKYTRFIDSVFNQTPAPTLPTRLDYVIQRLLEQTSQNPVFRTEQKLPGILYKITEVCYPDIGYRDLVTGYLMTLRTLMGLGGLDRNKTISYAELADHLVTGIGEFQPIAPHDLAGADIEKALQLFETLFIQRLIHRVITNDLGNYAGRISNVMDERKYTRNDTFDSHIRSGINIASYIFETFMDIASMFKFLSESDQIWYNDIHPVKRKQVSEYLNKYIMSFQNTHLKVSHPRFLMEPGILLTHSYSVAFETPDVAWFDTTYQRADKYLLDPQSFNFASWIKSPVRKGSILDAPIDMDPRIVGFAVEQLPFYFYSRPVPSLIADSEVIQRVLTFQKPDTFKKMLLEQWVQDKGSYKYFGTIEELALAFQIPFTLAKSLWKGPRLYFVLEDVRTVNYYWDAEVAPIFEVAIPDESRYVPPFVAIYPYLASRVVDNSGYGYVPGQIKTGYQVGELKRVKSTVDIKKLAKELKSELDKERDREVKKENLADSASNGVSNGKGDESGAEEEGTGTKTTE